MPIISLERVSKKYRISTGKRDLLKRILSFGGNKADQDFWALKSINLEVEPGTVLGILGRNGAGKTTLLQIISGVLQPTSGTVRVDGRLVALFQLGAGFNDEFTGRENIMLNGLILGIERKEMLERFDEIAAFADIGEFMDQPIKTYSSGMRARLGFAVAVSIEPDILLVDETLSVGDGVFKARGIQKMRELRDAGTTILFVSHSMTQVQDFCNEAALIHQGNLIARGETTQVIDQYRVLMANAAARRNEQLELDDRPGYGLAQDGDDKLGTPNLNKTAVLDERSPSLRHGTGEAKIQTVELFDESEKPVDVVGPESHLTARVHVRYTKNVNDSAVGIALRNDTGLDIFSTNTTLEKAPIGRKRAGEEVIVDFTFAVPLKNGRYSLAAAVSHPETQDLYLDWVGVAAVFKVRRPYGRGPFPGLVQLPTRVEVLEPDKVHERKPLG